MGTRRAIGSVLNNFLGTFASRNSDCGGYWVFGLLVSGLGHLETDLRASAPQPSDTPIVAFIRSLAVTKFQEQLSKAHLDPSLVRMATLVLERRPGEVHIEINNRATLGYPIELSVTALTNRGKVHRRHQVIVVAPHNPAIEHRSLRAAE